MSDSQNRIDLAGLRSAILTWLENRLDPETFREIDSTFNRLAEGAEDWEVFSSFSGVPRYTGKEKLELTTGEKQEAENIRPGWRPQHWHTDQLGRTLLVLGIAKRSKEEFLDKLEKLFISSDMGEAVALYQSLPVLPYPGDLKDRAAEGVRSNITSVFNAVALRNPYPADFMDDDAWNQIVLKALFVESPLYLIQGIDRRINKKLAKMLIEYAHERWSAGRVVSPELWRPVGPYIDEKSIEDIEKVLHNPEKIQQQAAVLALAASNSPAAKNLLEKYGSNSSADTIKNKEISWDDIGRKWNEAQQ